MNEWGTSGSDLFFNLGIYKEQELWNFCLYWIFCVTQSLFYKAKPQFLATLIWKLSVFWTSKCTAYNVKLITKSISLTVYVNRLNFVLHRCFKKYQEQRSVGAREGNKCMYVEIIYDMIWHFSYLRYKSLMTKIFNLIYTSLHCWIN